MITKILFTLAIIVVVIFVFKARSSQVQSAPRSGSQTAVVKKEESENQKMFRQGAILFMILWVITAFGVFWYKFEDQHTTVTVHVVNTDNGEFQSYKAEQNQIKSRKFVTVDGRTIYVADNERIELVPESE